MKKGCTSSKRPWNKWVRRTAVVEESLCKSRPLLALAHCRKRLIEGVIEWKSVEDEQVEVQTQGRFSSSTRSILLPSFDSLDSRGVCNRAIGNVESKSVSRTIHALARSCST
jgi:hypothetical protein